MKRGIIMGAAVLGAMFIIPGIISMSHDAGARTYFLAKLGLASNNATSGIDAKDAALRIHALVNEQRTKAGLAALQWDDQIASMALGHSQDMAAKDYFDHNSPDGKTLRDRIYQANLPCFAAAENIAQMNNPNSRGTEAIAQDTADGWMASPDHKANILDSHVTREGVALGLTSSGDVAYVTEDFC